MSKCPSCGHDNVDGTQFCEMCGEELKAAAAGSAPAGTPASGVPTSGGASVGAGTDAGMVRCPACDNLNPAENVVCEVCGTELRSGALGTPPGTSPTAVPTGAAPDAGTATAAGLPVPDAPASAVPADSTTPFDMAAQSQSASASTAASAPVPAAADSATSTNSDATLPTVSISSADPQSTDPLSNASAPITSTSTTDAPSTTDTSVMDPSVAPMAPASTSTSAPAAGGVLEPGKVKMVVEQGMTVGKQFVLGDAEVLVGREDEEDGIYPDVDLSDQDEGYVHRRHAQLKFENGGLSVTHLGGANKTRVNNRPLPDNTPTPVNMGDKVSFGKVVMRIQSV